MLKRLGKLSGVLLAVLLVRCEVEESQPQPPQTEPVEIPLEYETKLTPIPYTDLTKVEKKAFERAKEIFWIVAQADSEQDIDTLVKYQQVEGLTREYMEKTYNENTNRVEIFGEIDLIDMGLNQSKIIIRVPQKVYYRGTNREEQRGNEIGYSMYRLISLEKINGDYKITGYTEDGKSIDIMPEDETE